MNQRDELSDLLAAERAEERPAEQAYRVWQDLESALRADVPGLAVAHGPLKLGFSLAGKSALVSGVIAFVVTSGGLGAYSSWQSAPLARPRPAVSATRPTTVLSAPAEAARPQEPIPSVRPASPAAPRALPTVSEQTPSSLTEELRLMKAAKAELNAGRPHLATVWLEQHAQLFPLGVLRAERDGLRMLIACEASPAAAEPSARRFVEQNPESTLTDRISRACKLSGSGH